MATPEPELYPWLPFDTVRDHLRIKADSAELVLATGAIERARRHAAEYVEDNRPDRWKWEPVDGVLTRTEYVPGPRLISGALLAAARLYARAGTPLGTVSYGEFATQMMRSDPDIAGALGLGRYAKPRIG